MQLLKQVKYNEKVCPYYLRLVNSKRLMLNVFFWQVLQKDITCQTGFVHFYQEDFSEAKDLFM